MTIEELKNTVTMLELRIKYLEIKVQQLDQINMQHNWMPQWTPRDYYFAPPGHITC